LFEGGGKGRMPQVSQFDSSGPRVPGQIGSGPLRAVREQPPPRNPNRPPPAWAILTSAIVVAALVALVAVWMRRAPYRAWQRFAASIGGEFRSIDGMAPHAVSGTVRDRPFLLETGTSSEDDAPYYHTRGRVPLKNTGSFILGLRRKSLLESAQTMRDTGKYDLDDPDFERKFFLYCNDPDNLAAVLTAEARRSLSQFHDVEIYIRMGEMEWRRAGEVRDLSAIQRLTDTLLDMATAVDALPARSRSLTQVLADERLIEKGI